MGIGPQQKRRRRAMCLDGKVDARPLKACGIVQQEDAGIIQGKSEDDVLRAVGAASVRDDKARGGGCTGQKAFDDRTDMCGFVEGRHDDQQAPDHAALPEMAVTRAMQSPSVARQSVGSLSITARCRAA